MKARTLSVLTLVFAGTSLLACLGIGKDPEGTNAGECASYDCEAAEDCVREYSAVFCDDFINGIGLGACDQVCSND